MANGMANKFKSMVKSVSNAADQGRFGKTVQQVKGRMETGDPQFDHYGPPPKQNNTMNYLKKNAPETLKAPQRSQFADAASHAAAMARFKKKGHWATPDMSNPEDVKNIR